MGHYKSNLRDIEFNLFEVFRRQEVLGADPFPELDQETAKQILHEVNRLATGPLADSFAEGDRHPPVFDQVTGYVTMPEAIKRSFRTFMDAEWYLLDLPVELGGSGVPRSLGWAVAELVMGANPAVWMYSGGPLFASVLWELGTDEQKRFAELAIKHRWGATMVLTEPDAGSDVGAGRTTAIEQPDGTWHIEGVKRFITSAEHDMTENIFHLVLARPEGHGPGTKGLSLFLVPKFLVHPDGSLGGRNGVYATNVERKMGLKASATCELTFGAGHPAVGTLVGRVHDGIRQMFKVIEYARMMVGTKAIAALSTGYLNALDYAKNRVQGADLARLTDKTAPRVTITHHPDVRRMLMLQKAYSEGLRALVLYTATFQDTAQAAAWRQGEGSSDGTSEPADERSARVNELLLPIVKGVGSERSYEMLTVALQTLGGSGFLQDYPIEQYIRDAKIDSLYEGTTAIQAMDLYFRKIVRDGGDTLGYLLGQIKEFAAGEAGNGRLKAERAALARATGDVEAMVKAMGGFLAASLERPPEIYRVGLNATRLLMALGDLLIGWLLARQAEIALARLDGVGPDPEPDWTAAASSAAASSGAASSGAVSSNVAGATAGTTGTAADRAFYEGKVAAARFFAATVLPRLATERQITEETTLDLMELAEDAF